VLTHAYELCRANRGAAGVDGETFAAIEACGRERWLGALAGARTAPGTFMHIYES